jgi:hypothetical protein
MHLLAGHYHSEFLACPQLVRFDYVQGDDEFEPTLLVKGNTLLLKYLAIGVRMQLVIARLSDRLLYGLKVYDDPVKAAVIWSILEHEKEKSALAALARGSHCQIFLFNELAVNVAWSTSALDFEATDLMALLDGVAMGPVDHTALTKETAETFDRLGSGNKAVPGVAVVDIPGIVDWKPVPNTLITINASSSMIDLLDKDEGNQQEQICVWLTDNLHPKGSYHSPRVHNGKQMRELTDILLSYENGAFLIESKSLSIFSRDKIPDRAKLASQVDGHIRKAVSQLRGGIRSLRSGITVTNSAAKPIDIERTKAMHAIVLVPDLTLIESPKDYGRQFIAEFIKETGSFLHILDIAELLRVVQAAEMIAKRSTTLTPIMAFDYYLLQRAEKAMESGSLCLQILLRFDG